MGDVAKVNWILALAMLIGLLLAIFVTYARPREYKNVAADTSASDAVSDKFTAAHAVTLAGGVDDLGEAAGDQHYDGNHAHDLDAAGELVVDLAPLDSLADEHDQQAGLLALLYVPLCQRMGFSLSATILLMSSAAALGDAGSPASDSTLGPRTGRRRRSSPGSGCGRPERHA